MMDLSLFAKDEVPLGDYNVDIYINGSRWILKPFPFASCRTTKHHRRAGCWSVPERV